MYDTPTFYVLFTKIEERHLTYKWQLPRRNLAVLSEKSHHQVIPNGGIQVVCSARALSNGCKSRVSPNSGNYIAKGKGVHREVKSERSRRQTSDLTNRNFIQGI